MKQLTLVFTVTLLVSLPAFAQETAKGRVSAQGGSQTKAQTANQPVTLDSGTRLSAELLATLDARKAKPGDEFKMRTLKPVIVGGKEVIAKGSVLVGHVVESAQAEGKQEASRLMLSFDQLRNKNLTLPLSATIEQITRASINSQSQIGDLGVSSESGGVATLRSSGSSGANGGLLGGVTGAVGNTVGGVVGTTSVVVNDAVGGVTDTTRQATGNVIAVSSQTPGNTTANARGLIAISSASSAEAGGSSTLSLTGKNVRVEKGAVFLLRTDKSLNLAASPASNR